MKTVIQHVLKLRLERAGLDRIAAQVFLGPNEEHYQLAGELQLTIDEWQNIGCALRLGFERMTQAVDDVTYVPVRVTVEGQMKALGCEDDLKGKPDVVTYPEVTT